MVGKYRYMTSRELVRFVQSSMGMSELGQELAERLTKELSKGIDKKPVEQSFFRKVSSCYAANA